MRKNYRRAPVQPKRQYRINEQITAEKIRLIDENDEHVGVVAFTDALARARAAEMDLIEINPSADPPVCQINDFGRVRYMEEKELRKQKAKQKKVEIKGLRLTVRIGKHDLDVRVKQAKTFLEQNDKVKIEVVMRGRERQHTELAREVLETFLAALQKEGLSIVTESQPTLQGGRMSTIIAAKS